MPNSTLVDLVKVLITTTGTGSLGLGAAVSGFDGIDALTDGALYSYSIQQGANWEIGQGIYSAGSQTLTRGVIKSSYGAVAFPVAVNAVVSFTALARDFQVPGPPGAPGAPGNPGSPGPTGPAGAGINMPVSQQTGNYTLGSSDANTFVNMNSASALTLTVPAFASVPFPVGTVIAGCQLGAGKLTIAGASGVTIESRGSVFSAGGQYAVIQLKNIATDTWILLGDIGS